MRNKLLVLIFIFTLLPVISWGQSDITDIDLGSEGYTGYTIEKDGTYHFTGTFSGTPGQAINESKDVKAVINIAKDITATIILEDVNISLTGENQCPLFAGDAKEITLMIKGTNTLSTTNEYGNSPGLWVPEGKDKKIIIQNAEEGNNGTLTVQGTYGFPGIGIELPGQKSDITIESGIINAKGGDYNAGIEVNSNSELTINGGIITADGGDLAAGIGGGDSGAGGTCIITDGTVIANGGDYAAGIGGGYQGAGETCTITGGTVTANGGIYAAGIGNSYSSSGTPTFSTKDEKGNTGNAFIVTNSITDNATGKKSDWSGVIFEGNNGNVYGSPTIQTDATIPKDATLTIKSQQDLTIGNGITLTNEGTINNNSTISNNGTIDFEKGELIGIGEINGGTAFHEFKITLQDESSKAIINMHLAIIANDDNESIIGEFVTDASGEAKYLKLLHNKEYKIKVISVPESYKYYSLKADDFLDFSPVKLDKDIEIIFNISPNEFAVTNKEFITTYGDKFTDFNLNTLVSEANEDREFKPVSFSIEASALLKGLSFDNSTGIISGIIKAAVTNGQDIRIEVSNSIKSLDKFLKLEFKVTPRALTAALIPNQIVYSNEKDSYKPGLSFDNTISGEVPSYEGTFKVDDEGALSSNDLKLVDNGDFIASNYTVKYQDENKVKLIAENAATQRPIITGTYNEATHWYTSAVTLKAPEGFTISVSKTRLLSDPQQEITFDKGGQYQYVLKRDYSDLAIKGNINIDIIPPFITLSQDNLDFELTVSDEMSGIDKVLLDGTLITLTDKTYNGHSTAGNHTIEVFDVAGNKTTMSFTLEKKDDDPYVPPYEPDPVITYTVTLPAVEGITTDPVAGDYSVERYSSFSFTVTVAEGYREQSVPVIKVNGNVYDPVDADGRYKIKFIRSDQSVTVEGILADTPTANETLSTPAFELHTEGHTLCITVAQPRLCRLFDPSGRLICSRQLTLGINRLEGLAAGIYFVVVEREGVRKIVVQ